MIGAWAQDERKRWAILMTVGIGSIMSPLDSSVVNIALPVITADLNTTITVAEWVAAAYLLTISSLLLTYGRAGDLWGHRHIYVTGFAVFTAGSLLCSLSSNIGLLIAFRVVQAIGAGMMMAAGPALITAAFPANERGRALGLNGMMVGVGLAAGPVLGGLLVQLSGWRSIFLINLPIGLAGIWLAHRILPYPAPDRRRRRFDVSGAATFFIALLSLLLALSRGDTWGWRSAPITVLWIIGLLAFVSFFHIERRVADPMVDLHLFRIRLFAAANGSALLNYMAQFTVTFLMPFYLQQALGLPPQQAGLILLAFPVFMLLMAPFSGALSDRLGSYILSPLGMLIITVGLWLLSRLTGTTDPGSIFWRLAIVGLGSGLFQAPNNSAIMGSVPKDRLGLASGMLATMRNVGMVLGVAVSAAVFSSRHDFYLYQEMTGRMFAYDAGLTPYVAAVRDTFLVGSGFALLGVVTAMVRGRPGTGTGSQNRQAQQGEAD
ncbi:MAG TPA: MFS transporter [Firmicutes bacterium]|nr:MFS transporter [Bacillota bacterium]